jgi:quercetin dioxygenase-like cupin family protein
MSRTANRRILVAGLTMIVLASSTFGRQQPQPLKKPVPKVIQLNPRGQDYLRVLAGPPETSTMRSGLVALAPHKSVGKHSTEKYEELVIILEGQAEMKITGGERLRLGKGFAAYCPPHTEHDVLNVGTETLRYIYVVAEAKM